MPYWVWFILAFFILDVVVVAFVFVRRSRKKGNLSQYDRSYLRSHWQNVEALAKTNPASAIIEADKLLDYALDKSGAKGTLGDKLKQSGSKLSDLNGVWSAHKLRNKLAHEIDHKPSKFAVMVAVKVFKKALNDLGARL